MASTPDRNTDEKFDLDRTYSDADINRTLGRVDEEGAAVERRSGLISIMSRLLWLHEHEKGRADLLQLERELMVLEKVLDGRPIARGHEDGGRS